MQPPDWTTSSDFLIRLGGGLALLWAFLKWLLLPLIRVGLREVLKEELTMISKAARDITKCAESWEEIDLDLEAIEGQVHALTTNVHANREWMGEFSLVLDSLIGIERRKKGDPSGLPTMPELPPPLRPRPRRNRDRGKQQ